MLRVLGFIVGAAVGLVLLALVTLAGAGLATGAANAWVLEGPFMVGWNAVWDRWAQALVWAWLFGGSGILFGGSAR